VIKSTLEILCVFCAAGTAHDFEMFKTSVGSGILSDIKALCDKGYQGILAFHKNTALPKKKPKNGQLTAAEKAENRRISKERICVEHVNAKLKVFKILSTPYRNRRKRFSLRVNIIAAILNRELD
jgi:hypothetical protein